MHRTKLIQRARIASNETKTMFTLSSEQMEDLRAALFSMPSDDYDLWIAMGQALCKINGGYELWAEWSATSEKHRGEADLIRWKGFVGDNTSFKAVFSHAQAREWINPRKKPDPKEIFKPQPNNQVQLISSPPQLLSEWSTAASARDFLN